MKPCATFSSKILLLLTVAFHVAVSSSRDKKANFGRFYVLIGEVLKIINVEFIFTAKLFNVTIQNHPWSYVS